MSAVSKKLRPASMQTSTIFMASATSAAPQALKNSSSWPPKVPVPKQSSGTLKPERPSCRYSIGLRCASIEGRFNRGRGFDGLVDLGLVDFFDAVEGVDFCDGLVGAQAEDAGEAECEAASVARAAH